jgi:isopenicillin N synthase-like dioxygenase
MTEFSQIPILDLSPLHSDDVDAIRILAQAFRETYATTGFGYIKGHGIPQSLIDAAFSASAAFHGLPQSEKMKIALDQNHRGFIPINTSTDVNSKLADVKRPNQSESFMMMREDGKIDPNAFLSGPTQWPNLDGFREAITAYHDALTKLSRQLVGLVELALDAPASALSPAFETPTTWLRLLHYPTTDPMDGDDLFGSAPHTDFGFLTILAQDNIGGLQVQTPAGHWIDAPKIEGTFVVNVGDMLHRWSNGILKSTPHRVINRSGKARYSCPFFFDPHVSANIAPLKNCQAGEGPMFEPINFGDFLRSELTASYDAHKDQDER